MSNPNPTTLFVCHEGQRTGAPLLLLWLIRWLVANTSIRPVVALMRDGPLRQEFAALCPTHTFTRPVAEPWTRRLRRRFDASLSTDPESWLARVFERVQPDCLYLNTLVLGYCLAKLPINRQKTRVISSVHEMEIGLLLSSNRDLIRAQIMASDILTCEGSSVASNLIENHQAEKQRCIVMPAYVPFETPEQMLSLRCDAQTQPTIDRLESIRKQGIFIFGFAGSAIDRKGFDLFPQLVRICVSRFGSTPFRAVWVGCPPGSLAYIKAERDLSLLGVRDQVMLLPGVSCGAAALQQFDVLSCLSREDPGPVVSIEAGALAVPSVCFRHCGGIAEFAEMGLSCAVDYLDLEAFAEALLELQQNPRQRQEIGRRFQRHIFEHQTVSVQAARIAALISGDPP